MTPPSPYLERVVLHATLQSAVPFVTITTLWLAAHALAGSPSPHCRGGFRHGSASGPHACSPSHRPTPGRVPKPKRSTHALLGARLISSWARNALIGSRMTNARVETVAEKARLPRLAATPAMTMPGAGRRILRVASGRRPQKARADRDEVRGALRLRGTMGPVEGPRRQRRPIVHHHHDRGQRSAQANSRPSAGDPARRPGTILGWIVVSRTLRRSATC